MEVFAESFECLTGHPPFPWQVALYGHLVAGEFQSIETCSLPTGLGKTSIIALWLMALAARPTIVPRRLVYVVNRRTVVDQTTTEVERLRENLQNCPDVETALRNLCAFTSSPDGKPFVPLAISTLRGQFADNQEWSSDPARPAVICGTVDMIGSRLLFSGYRCGFRSRPLQAGFLGQDVLLVHDEAHLEPAFQDLLIAISNEQETGRFPDARPLKVVELSATARGGGSPFTLTPPDYQHPTVQKRIEAAKRLVLHPVNDEKAELVDALVKLALAHQGSGQAVLVFARTVETVERVADVIRNKLPKVKPEVKRVATLTGTMRGHERERLIEEPIFRRFLPPKNEEDSEATTGTVYLVCTSAGEVGVNISADHLVCDLTPFDSMAQRFGRVNRFGDCGDTRIDIVHPTTFASEAEAEKKPALKLDPRRELTLQLLRELDGDASPAALSDIDEDRRRDAFSQKPITLPTSDILFDAWALTTIKGKLPGRPPVEEYLHGKADWEPPQTQVGWRDEVDVFNRRDVDGRTLLEQMDLSEDKLSDLLNELLSDYPLKPHELLQDRSDRVFDKLKKIADRSEVPIPVWIIDQDDTIAVTTLQALATQKKDDFTPRTVLLPPSAGGLAEDGLMTHAATAVVKDVADEWYTGDDPPRRCRERLWDPESGPRPMRLVRTIDTRPGEEEFETDDEADETVQKRLWKWFVRPAVGDDDGSKSAPVPIEWDHHTNDVRNNAIAIGNAILAENDELCRAVVLAARLHDLGKRRVAWQRSIGNPSPDELPWYAKSGVMDGRRWRPLDVTRYRHEFGSLLDLLYPQDNDRKQFADALSEFDAMSEDMRDVVLHLIAVHHGRGRPHFPEEEDFDYVRSQEQWDGAALEVPRRFARLQRKYGRWGLAWLESLLRAADIAASAYPSANGEFAP